MIPFEPLLSRYLIIIIDRIPLLAAVVHHDVLSVDESTHTSNAVLIRKDILLEDGGQETVEVLAAMEERHAEMRQEQLTGDALSAPPIGSSCYPLPCVT